MFIPYRPPEVTACISTRKCVVRFETECSRGGGAILSSRLSTNLSLPNTSTMFRIQQLKALHFKKLTGCIDNQGPDDPRRLAFSNFEHLVSLSSEHKNTQTDRQLKTMSGSLSKL